MAGSHFTGPVYSSKGFYGPTYTYATLPAASGYQNGSSLFTSDQGWYTAYNGTWQATGGQATVKHSPSGTRIGLIGDSLMLRGFASTQGSAYCTVSVTSPTEVQITQTSHSMTVGNKVILIWTDQPLLNSYCTSVIRLDTTTPANVFYVANPGITGNYPITVNVFNGLINQTGTSSGSTLTLSSVAGLSNGLYVNGPGITAPTSLYITNIVGNTVTLNSSVNTNQPSAVTFSFSLQPNIGCWSMTNILQVGFTPLFMATQPDTYFSVASAHTLPGATSAQVNAYCVPNALKMASYPDEWWYLTGANDVGAIPVATTMASVASTMNQLLSTGKTVRLFTPNAYGNTATPGTIASGAGVQELRQQQIETYKNNPQVILFDLDKWMIDPLSLVGNAKSTVGATSVEYNSDAAHPSPTGCYQTGKGFWSDMKLAGSSQLPPISPLFPVSQMDSNAYAAGVGYSNLGVNPMLLGTAGNVTGTGTSGQCADNWQVQNLECDTVSSLASVSRSDGKPGYFNQLTLTKASGNGRCRFQPYVTWQSFVNTNTNSMGAGWYVIGMEVNFSITSGVIKWVRLQADFTDASGNTQIVRFMDGEANNWITGTTTDTLTYVSYPFYVGANNFQTSAWTPFLEMMVNGGTSIFKIGRPFMRRINM